MPAVLFGRVQVQQVRLKARLLTASLEQSGRKGVGLGAKQANSSGSSSGSSKKESKAVAIVVAIAAAAAVVMAATAVEARGVLGQQTRYDCG